MSVCACKKTKKLVNTLVHCTQKTQLAQKQNKTQNIELNEKNYNTGKVLLSEFNLLYREKKLMKTPADKSLEFSHTL